MKQPLRRYDELFKLEAEQRQAAFLRRRAELADSQAHAEPSALNFRERSELRLALKPVVDSTPPRRPGAAGAHSAALQLLSSRPMTAAELKAHEAELEAKRLERERILKEHIAPIVPRHLQHVSGDELMRIHDQLEQERRDYVAKDTRHRTLAKGRDGLER